MACAAAAAGGGTMERLEQAKRPIFFERLRIRWCQVMHDAPM